MNPVLGLLFRVITVTSWWVQWHDECNDVTKSQPRDCSLNRLFADQRKHKSSVLLAFVWGIHRWPVNSPQKGPVTRKMFPFDDAIMFVGNGFIIQGAFHCAQRFEFVFDGYVSNRPDPSDRRIYWFYLRVTGRHTTIIVHAMLSKPLIDPLLILYLWVMARHQVVWICQSTYQNSRTRHEYIFLNLSYFLFPCLNF